MNKKLIFRDEKKAAQFAESINSIIPQLQSLVGSYANLNIGEITEGKVQMLLFDEPAIRRELAGKAYKSQGGGQNVF